MRQEEDGVLCAGDGSWTLEVTGRGNLAVLGRRLLSMMLRDGWYLKGLAVFRRARIFCRLAPLGAEAAVLESYCR